MPLLLGAEQHSPFNMSANVTFFSSRFKKHTAELSVLFEPKSIWPAINDSIRGGCNNDNTNNTDGLSLLAA